MAEKKITELNLLTYATAAAGDLLIIEDIDGAETKAITAEDLAKYALDNRTIGGTTAGDIVTVDGTQTLTNKTITSPSVNGGAALTVTSDELNLLDGLTADYAELNILDGATLSTAELNCLEGVTSAIQTQLNALWTVAGTTARTFTYAEEWSDNAAASKTITEATINTAGSVPSGYYVDHTSIICALYTRDGDTYTQVDLDGSTTFKISRTNVGGGVQGLDKIVLSGLTNDSATDYLFTCTYRVVTAQGA